MDCIFIVENMKDNLYLYDIFSLFGILVPRDNLILIFNKLYGRRMW